MRDESRRLDWPDCANARDLGGLATRDGGRVRARALVRSDCLDRLTPTGVAALQRYGVSRIVDLRSAPEALANPGPLADDPRYRLLPLVDPSAEARRNRAAEPTLAAVFRASVIRNAGHIVAGLAAIADAPPGAVVVHCSFGKDRTGMAVALALRVAGATDDAITADYAYTCVCLGPRFEAALAAAPDEATRADLRRRQSCDPRAIMAMLREVEERHGSVSAYLLTHGLTEAQLAGLRRRLRGAR